MREDRLKAVLRFHVAIGCALAVIGLTSVAAGAQGGGSAKDPLKLFEPMYPVFTSARCANCHGSVDPIAGVNHDQIEEVPLDAGNMLPGQEGNSKCLDCHDEDAEHSVWRLAPSQIAFINKAPLELCRQIRDDNGLRDGDPASFAKFIQHLSGDQLIGFAFEGRRAMIGNDQQPPPMSRPMFVSLANRWLQEGKAKCSTWNGTIKQTIVQTGPLTSNITIEISVKDGDALAAVHMDGHQHSTGQGCFMRDDTFTVDTGNSLIPVDLIVMLSSELGPPGFQPPPLPAMPPGVPAPPNIFANNGYTLLLQYPAIDGTDHWEQVNTPPACAHTSGDSAYTLRPNSGVLNKMLGPREPDHLHDTDVQSSNGATMTTEWDLTRE